MFERNSYAGEALLERLKPGEERLIPFGVDLATLVHTSTTSGHAPAFLVRVANGVFRAHYYQSETKTYHLTTQFVI